MACSDSAAARSVSDKACQSSAWEFPINSGGGGGGGGEGDMKYEVCALHMQAADVYSFGVMLWEMYTGQRAWAALNYAQVGIPQ